MGSHSVTCHPTEVTFLPLPQPKLVLDLAPPEGCQAELIWVVIISQDIVYFLKTVTYLRNNGTLSCESGVLTTRQDHQGILQYLGTVSQWAIPRKKRREKVVIYLCSPWVWSEIIILPISRLQCLICKETNKKSAHLTMAKRCTPTN